MREESGCSTKQRLEKDQLLEVWGDVGTSGSHLGPHVQLVSFSLQ